jgi:hypothetical protein
VTESILNNQNCFLEEPEWIAVLRSIFEEHVTPPATSPTGVSLMALLISIPRLFREMTMLICCDRQGQGSAAVDKAISRARHLQASLREWSEYFMPTKTAFIMGVDLPSHPELSRQLIQYYVCTIYCNRLNTCMYHPWEMMEVLRMEEESQLCASHIVSLNTEQLVHSGLQASLLLIQKLPLAEAVVTSADEWRDSIIRGTQQTFVMPRQTFQNWCGLLGRTML